MNRSRYFAQWTSNQWRIIRAENGFEANICGAVSEAVAWAQCDILNALSRSPS